MHFKIILTVSVKLLEEQLRALRLETEEEED